MKKFNVNIILFIAVIIFIFAGFNKEYLQDLKYEILSFVVQNEDAAEDLPTMLKKVEKVSADKLRYHNVVMDLNSLCMRVTNTQLVQKSSSSILARTDCDSLVELQTERFTEENLEIIADRVAQLQKISQTNGAEFLYVIAPRKTHAMDVPENAADYRKENLAAFEDQLDARNINTLNLCDVLKQENRLNGTLFYRTDHHWKTETGFWASGEICRELNNRYGFDYDSGVTDLSNYDVTVYEDCFLGSYGRKIGTYFVSGGRDDFSLITPKFETNLTVVDPYDNLTLTGDFQQTLLKLDNLKERDHYEANVYGVYRLDIGRIQTITNHLKPEGKRILLIQDSFGCVVTPFLSLNSSEVHTIDPRPFLHEGTVNVFDYIEQFRPDYVILLYGGLEDLPDGCGRYDFDQNPS